MKTYNPVDIWNLFKLTFPSIAKDAKQFRSHGNKAITIWFSNKEPFIFTIMPNNNWKLEPYNV